MTEEGIGQEFRLKNKKARYYFIKETDQNELMSSKSQKACMTLTLNFLSLIFTITECISIAAFASLVDIYTEIMSTEIMSSTIGLNICLIVTRIKESK